MRFLHSTLLLSLITTSFALSVPRSSSLTPYEAALQSPSQGQEDIFEPSGKNGVVATEVDACSNIGAVILKKGGSAADAVSVVKHFLSTQKGSCI